MADPIYDFKQTKPSLADDVDPTQIPPPPDRLFAIPIFQPNGDRVANLQLKAVFLAPGKVVEPGSYNVQLFLNTGALGAYVAYGPVYTGLTENASVSLPFGDVDTAAYSGFFRVTSAVSAGGGTSMLFTCTLLEAPPVKYDATGVPVAPIPSGAATAALQTSGNASLASIDGKVATQTTLAAVLAKLSADPATQTTLAAVLAKISADPATQTTLAAVLAKLSADPATQTTLAALLAALSTPTLPTAVTPSDATDLTTLATKGCIIGGAGNLAFRAAGAPSTTVALAVTAGQYVPFAMTRIMAATTATGIVACGG